MKQDLDLTNFTAGELSPRMMGRVDESCYYNGTKTCLNMVPLAQGGATRRPGTQMVALAGDQVNPVRLVPFIFSTVQPYILEFGGGYVCFYMNDGVIAVSGAPVQISVPYQATDLAALKFTQSDDTLYIVHPNYPPANILRFSHTNWVYQVMTFFDGPYQDVNVTGTMLKGSATTGSITVTATGASISGATNNGAGLIRIKSTKHALTNKDTIIIAGVGGTTGANGTWAINVVDGNNFDLIGSSFANTYTSGGTACLSVFASTDVGRMLRMKVSTTWTWLLITAYTSAQQVTAQVQAAVIGGANGTLDGTGTTVNWRLGKWGATTGAYPYTVMFWQNRLTFSGTDAEPGAIESSVTGDFTNFAPTNFDSTVATTNALSWIISDDQVNATRWLSPAGSSQAAQLAIGTTGGENIMQPGSTSSALSATNVQVYRETTYGSAPNVNPLRIGKSVLFTNRPGRKVHEYTFSWQVNGYLGPDLTVFAEHITRLGIVQMVYQQSPYSVVWAILANGGLIGMTYMKEQEVKGWHRHQLGGSYYGGSPKVESIAVIPSPDGTYDELWLSVLRTNGTTPIRTVEAMTRYFDDQPVEQSFFVDCGLSNTLSYPSCVIIPSAASGTGVAFTLSAALTLEVGGMVRFNGGVAIIRTVTDSTHFTADWLVDAVNYAPALSTAWSYGPPLSTVSGLSYLNGQSVRVLGDGADLGMNNVSGGSVSLPQQSTLVTVGYPYLSELLSMPMEPQSAAASQTAGKVKNITTMYLRLMESLGCNYGVQITDDFTGQVTPNLTPLPTRSASDVMGSPPQLFSGVARLNPVGGYDQEAQIIVNTSGSMPLTVLSIGVSYEVGDLSS